MNVSRKSLLSGIENEKPYFRWAVRCSAVNTAARGLYRLLPVKMSFRTLETYYWRSGFGRGGAYTIFNTKGVGRKAIRLILSELGVSR